MPEQMTDDQRAALLTALKPFGTEKETNSVRGDPSTTIRCKTYNLLLSDIAASEAKQPIYTNPGHLSKRASDQDAKWKSLQITSAQVYELLQELGALDRLTGDELKQHFYHLAFKRSQIPSKEPPTSLGNTVSQGLVACGRLFSEDTLGISATKGISRLTGISQSTPLDLGSTILKYIESQYPLITSASLTFKTRRTSKSVNFQDTSGNLISQDHPGSTLKARHNSSGSGNGIADPGLTTHLRHSLSHPSEDLNSTSKFSTPTGDKRRRRLFTSPLPRTWPRAELYPHFSPEQPPTKIDFLAPGHCESTSRSTLTRGNHLGLNSDIENCCPSEDSVQPFSTRRVLRKYSLEGPSLPLGVIRGPAFLPTTLGLPLEPSVKPNRTSTSMPTARPTLSVPGGPEFHKRQAIQEAQNQQAVTEEKLAKLHLKSPDYVFMELIGKGQYGRVYKSVHRTTSNVVAIKVLETDAMDFNAKSEHRDGGISDALKEIQVLNRLRQSKAVNVNMFLDAFQVHSQLWIVSEYCPGGSLTTLRRATGNKLTERHIIPIARELAAGLKAVHAAGIIHRDIKCSNVMIGERGNLQIIDFGVAGTLQSNLEVDKRKTVIGTPHWMPPELQKNLAEVSQGYSYEVDVWAYGITLYECATGAPPHAHTGPGRELNARIRQNPAPRLHDNKFSRGLQDLIAFTLNPDPAKRPNMAAVCSNLYLADTEQTYPTESLRELVEAYYLWETRGGQRTSLWLPGGAAQPQFMQAHDNDEEEWTFSTSAGFDQLYGGRLIDSMKTHSSDPNSDYEFLSSSPPRDDLDAYARGPSTQPSEDGTLSSSVDEKKSSAKRGEQALKGIFDQKAEPYRFDAKAKSDLPLRSDTSAYSVQNKEVHYDSDHVTSSTSSAQINLDSIPSKKAAKRDTLAWRWEDNLGAASKKPVTPAPLNQTAPKAVGILNDLPVRPKLQHSITEPVGITRPMSDMLDLDALMGGPTPSQSRPFLYGHESTNTTAPNSDDEEDDFDGYTMRPIRNHQTSNSRDDPKPEESQVSQELALSPPREADSTFGLNNYHSTDFNHQVEDLSLLHRHNLNGRQVAAPTALGFSYQHIRDLRIDEPPYILRAPDPRVFQDDCPEDTMVNELSSALQGHSSALGIWMQQIDTLFPPAAGEYERLERQMTDLYERSDDEESLRRYMEDDDGGYPGDAEEDGEVEDGETEADQEGEYDTGISEKGEVASQAEVN